MIVMRVISAFNWNPEKIRNGSSVEETRMLLQLAFQRPTYKTTITDRNSEWNNDIDL